MKRRFGLALAVLLSAGVVAAVIWHAWVGAQVRATIVLSTTIRTPVLTWTVGVLTADPRVEEARVAGLPSTLARPGGRGPWPALVFVNGATRRGRHHPDVQRLARGLARAGYLVLVPDLPGLRRGEITDRTVAGTVAAGLAVANRSDARHHRVGFVGVSVGATLALLAAEDPRLAGRVAFIGGIAPYSDLRKVVRLATTGVYANNRYETDDYLPLAVARSLAAGLAPGRDRRRLVRALNAIPDDQTDPLAGLPQRNLGRPARALVALLENRDPGRYDALYRRLSARLRAGIARLSPIRRATRLRTRIVLASAPHDKYFPTDESRALSRATPDANVSFTVTRTLDHAIPKPSLKDLADLFRFDGFVVRALRAASG